MDDQELDGMHHADCRVRAMAHVFNEPECDCPVSIIRRLQERVALLEAVRDAADDVYDAHMTERSSDPTAKSASMASLESALDTAEAVLGPSGWEKRVVEDHYRKRAGLGVTE